MMMQRPVTKNPVPAITHRQAYTLSKKFSEMPLPIKSKQDDGVKDRMIIAGKELWELQKIANENAPKRKMAPKFVARLEPKELEALKSCAQSKYFEEVKKTLDFVAANADSLNNEDIREILQAAFARKNFRVDAYVAEILLLDDLRSNLGVASTFKATTQNSGRRSPFFSHLLEPEGIMTGIRERPRSKPAA
jgi:hypothetical protein